jgi:predicted PolB exonuclease-like 3'-5' exonuclease
MAMTREQTSYIVFDIETVPDGELLAEVLYPGEGLSPEEAVDRQEREVEEQSGGRTSFVPLSFHMPVAIAVARVGADFQLQKVAILDAPEYRSRRMVELFWKGLDSYPEAALVDFGGRTFDLPVLELAAYRHGISVPPYFSATGGRGYRRRYNERHLDLLEWFTNWGASRLRGGLDLLAKMIGKPGKLLVRGEQVRELWRAGKKDLVGSYCLCDVCDTYFVFLRSRVLTGELTTAGERRLAEKARGLLEDLAFEDENLEAYLSSWKASEET